MIASYAAVCFLGLALVWTAINKSGVAPFDWYVTTVLIGASLLAYWGRTRRTLAPPLKPWVRWTIVVTFCYMVFQLVPLPLSLLSALSPARAELARELAPVAGSQTYAPLSVNPPAHLLWLLTIAGCLATFFLVRELAFRLLLKPWIILCPLVGIATFEAVLGLMQVASGGVQATGTYNGRDHYVCILEMILPITITYGMLLFSRREQTGQSSIFPLLAAAGMWVLASVQLLAILASLSRAGTLDALVALIAVALLLLVPQLNSPMLRGALLVCVLIGLGGLLVLASPAALLARLADTGTQNEGRLLIWREAAPLHKEFALFGTGLLGFDPTFLKYQAFANAKRVDFAHNDYLQYLIELGIIGFVPLVCALGGVLWPILSSSWRPGRPDRRMLLVGCTAGLLALAVHSVVDFNLYVPANLLAFSWIAGYGSVYAAGNVRRSLTAPKSD